jgi:hypothetical protein
MFIPAANASVGTNASMSDAAMENSPLRFHAVFSSDLWLNGGAERLFLILPCFVFISEA